MKSEGVVYAVLYGHLSGHSKSTIIDNLQKLGEHVASGFVSGIVETHLDAFGRIRHKSAIGKRNTPPEKHEDARILKPKTRGKVAKFVKTNRGNAVVTGRFIQKKIPEARKVTVRTVTRVLNEKGMNKMRRRKKQCTSKPNKKKRVDFAKKVNK